MADKLLCSEKKSTILEIYHSKSMIHSYYDMSEAIQFTFCYCSGLSAEDYYNVFSVSPNKDYFFTSPINSNFQEYNARSSHQHAFFEFLIVLEGSIMQRLEEKEYLYPAGTCCLINQNIFHTEKYIGQTKILFIDLSIHFIKELLELRQTAYYQREDKIYENSILEFMAYNIQLEKGKNYLDFLPVFQNRKSISDLHKISDQLLRSMLFPTLGSTYLIKGLICELFQYLDSKKFYHISSVKINSSSDLLLFSRIGHLMEDTDGRMSRSDLEKALCYSGNYMNTIVKKYSGMCLYDYGLTFAMKKAAYLLANTDKPISAIEVQLGFTNRTHFYKIFKKKFGFTPGEYRSKMKNHDF